MPIPLYLEKIHFVFNHALTEHPRTFAIRADLRFSPDWFTDSPPVFCNLSDGLMTRFTRSLQSQIDNYLKRKQREQIRVHPCNMRYIWVREQNNALYSHYHAIIFVNKDVFRDLGRFGVDGHGLGFMIQSAWLSALGLRGDTYYLHLAHFPVNAGYLLERNSSSFDVQRNVFFERASYLAKETTKYISPQARSIGYSQN